MPLDIAAEAINLGSNLVGQATGGIMNEVFHNQQVRHQKDFINQQIEASNIMNRNNQTLALDTWNKTSYPAQMEKMKEAGLNPGLMYGGAGSGGTTNFGGSSTATAGQAPKSTEVQGMGIMQASQLALMKAQKDNIEADTANKKADIPVKQADVPLKGAQQKSIETGIPKTEEETKGISIDNRMKLVNARLTEANESNRLGILNEEYNKIKADVALTQVEKLKAQSEITRMGIENILTKSNVEYNTAKINETIAAIIQKWRELEIKGIAVGSEELHRGEQELKDKGLDTQSIKELIGLGLILAK